MAHFMSSTGTNLPQLTLLLLGLRGHKSLLPRFRKRCPSVYVPSKDGLVVACGVSWSPGCRVHGPSVQRCQATVTFTGPGT